jgi:formylglycine-generating enzyme required for sulfatase activity
VQDSDSVAVLEAFLKQFPQGIYAELAKARLRKLKETKVAIGIFPKPEAEPKPGEEFQDCDNCPKMVVVPAGSFTMGSPPSEKERGKYEGPQRSVTIPSPWASSR